MKIIVSVISKMGNAELENVAIISLLVHTFLWFVLGGCVGRIWAVVVQASGEAALSCIVTAGSACALIFGYLCGVVYLLRREA